MYFVHVFSQYRQKDIHIFPRSFPRSSQKGLDVLYAYSFDKQGTFYPIRLWELSCVSINFDAPPSRFHLHHLSVVWRDKCSTALLIAITENGWHTIDKGKSMLYFPWLQVTKRTNEDTKVALTSACVTIKWKTETQSSMSATRRKRDMEKDRDKRVNKLGCAANTNVPTLFLLGQRPHTWINVRRDKRPTSYMSVKELSSTN